MYNDPLYSISGDLTSMAIRKRLRLFRCLKCGNNTFHEQIVRRSSRSFANYTAMKTRCLDKRTIQYKNYGGRGIKICERWLESFDNFYADMGEPPTLDHSLDRIDNNGDYTPHNCRWATRTEQNNNNRVVRKLEYKGKILTTREWSNETGISKVAIDERIILGWPIEKILTTPAIVGRNQFGEGKLFRYKGKDMTLKQWAVKLGVSYYTLHKRITKYGWSISKTFSTPVKEKG